MIHDRIVVCIQERKLSEKLELDPAPTLDKAITSVRQTEAVKKQQGAIRGDRQEEGLVTDCPIQAVRPGLAQGHQSKGSDIRHIKSCFAENVQLGVPRVTNVQNTDIFRSSAVHHHKTKSKRVTPHHSLEE